MKILSLNISDISIITTMIVSFGTILGTIIKLIKTNKQNIETFKNLPEKITSIEEKQEWMIQDAATLHASIAELKDQIKDTANNLDRLETQQLKYIINDAVDFSQGGTIRDISQERLVNASQCCEIYISKGLNHEIGAKCKNIYGELDRRQIEGGNNE